MSAQVEALGWVLVHSLWQGAALWLGLEAVLAWPRLDSPRSQGRLAGGALTVFVLLVAGTYGWMAREGRDEAGGQRTNPIATATAAMANVAGGPAATEGALSAEPAGARWTRPAMGARSAPAWRERMRPALPWLVGAWAAGVVLGLVRHGREWWFLRRLARASLVVLPTEWLERFAALCARCAPGRVPPRIGETRLVSVPLVIGGLAPAILLPAGFLTGLSPAQVEAVLAHELAHLVRRDFWLNALQ